jgi:glycosyltransferase involved in cell wall biosynthesis
MRIWIDVEDLFQYASNTSRPSGIQRLAFELQRALLALAPDEVRFVRHNAAMKDFVAVPFAEIAALFANLTATAPSRPAPAPVVAPVVQDDIPALPPAGPARRLGRRIMARFSPEVANPLRRFRAHQIQALRDLRDAARMALHRNGFRPNCFEPSSFAPHSFAPKDHAKPPVLDTEPAFKNCAAPGDWLLCLGSPWFMHDYAELIGTACAQYGLRFGVLLYDIIPLRRPEWCDRNLVKSFRIWFNNILPLADRLLAISRTTAEDVERYVAEAGITLRSRVQPIPLGTGFGEAPPPVRSPRLPPAKSFALIVSTIEARKNHVLLFRIWRELLAIMPRDQVPTLVFAGRVGWLVADLMQQLENANWLDGKILLIEEPCDGELAALYEDCLFTLYPSLYEGWGLPVSESLIHGAPCLAARCTSLPEAGGRYARYFDPDNLHDAVRAVQRLLEDPAALEAWREEIQEFRHNPPGWDDSAAATLRLLHQPDPASAPSKEHASTAAAGTC